MALALNVTAVAPTSSTYLTVWPSGIDGLGRPTVSNLNPAKGQTVPNAVITGVGPTWAFNVYNRAGTTNVVVDVAGTFDVRHHHRKRPSRTKAGLARVPENDHYATGLGVPLTCP